jgi:hypothetical protein
VGDQLPSADGARWYSWLLFTVDILPLDSLHDAISWIAPSLVQIAPPTGGAARYLDFAKQLVINVIFVAGIWRGINIHIDVSQAIRTLALSPDPCVRVGRRASGKLRKVLRDEEYAEELYGEENAKAARHNAAEALGKILKGLGHRARLESGISVPS